MLDDAAWKQYRVYCTWCHKWLHPIRHESCPTGQHGSVIMIDIAGLRKGCTKCGHIWPVANDVIHCGRGHEQPVQYVPEIPPLPHGDKVLKTDGDLSWVVTRTHFNIMGKLSR